MAESFHIVVTQGHRNTSGGDPAEAARTPAIANAIVRELQTAGHRASCLQNSDGTVDNWFSGSLDAVARAVMRIHAADPVDLLLDIHIEGNAANTPGVFVIVPDGTGLKTLTAYTGIDRATVESRDFRLARAIAHEVARSTGLALRRSGVLEPGVMSEQATHVGADLGWRLAMFGYTAPARSRMTRIVLECGNIRADRAVIDGQGFAERVATGVVAALADFVGDPPAPWPPFGTIGSLSKSRLVTVTTPVLRLRPWAETSVPVVATLGEGSRFPVMGWVIGELVEGNPVWWITGTTGTPNPGWRMWSGGTDLAGAAVLELPHPGGDRS